ncbi:MAG: translation elongation factor Ts [Oscillospiraceae bacterium]|nr:translation elongation factor Ts [Oscillospiraceae bacterium]
MAFTAQDVKALREMTNVGMMDCKKALQACDGDMEKAVDWLREKGLAKAAKKAGRIAAEGMSFAKVCPNCGAAAVVEVNCETDFCAKSELFTSFVKDICDAVIINNPADVDALMQCKYPGKELTISETMPEKVMSIGENLQIRRFVRYSENTSVSYVHAGGSRGVIVNLKVEGDIDATEIGKNVAMQIAAMAPKYWDKSLVPQEDIDHELAVQVAAMANDPKMASKPDAVKEKIAAGKINAYYKEWCLLQQDFVRSDIFSGSVEGYIADAAKKLGGKVTFVDATHFITGEGIEKKEEDFAAEVAAQLGK